MKYYKINFPFALVLSFCIFISSCKKDTPTGIDYFSFGKGYGFCIGDCATFYQIRNGKLYEDDMLRYVDTLKFTSIPLAQTKYELAQPLLAEFPLYFKMHPNQTFGCPDCADQGGFHIEMKQGNSFYFWHIDADKTKQPQELQSYLARMDSVITLLK